MPPLVAPSTSCTFVQPRAPQEDSNSGTAAAVLGASVALANSLPAEALWHGPFPGPLYGSSVCIDKPIKWFTAPLCDYIYWLSPIYITPVMLAIFAGGVSFVQILIPATQPDEDLR